MSGFDQRSQEVPANVYADYAITRPASSQTYTGYASSPLVHQFSSSQPPEVHAISPSHHMPFLGHHQYEPRDTSYQSSSDLLSIPKNRIAQPSLPISIEVTSKGPYYGKAGEKLRVTFCSETDFALRPSRFTYFLQTVACPAICTKLTDADRTGRYHYSLDSDIPTLDGVVSQFRMPLLLDIRSDDGEIYSPTLGEFTYVSLANLGDFPLQQLEGKKRKLDATPSATNFSYPMAKRAASNPQQMRYPSTGSSLSVQSPPPPIPQQYLSTSSQTPLFAVPSGYDKPVAQARPHAFPVSRTPRYALGPELSMNQKARSPRMPSGSFGVGGLSISPPKQRMASSKRAAMADLRSPSMPNPQLIRTSVLEQSQQSSINRGFNPYALYSTGKAKLMLQGDLMAMTQDWTPEENTIQRRLVEFTRAQTGNVVTALFKPVTLEERTPNSTCVSCIYWQDRDEYFVTSVDTIALLEGLIAARFTVEEKNRIRRNLEGYKPLTVSKLREDTDAFFRLIMGFPAPKPRNIEKDVKVFPWAKLTEALNKIFDKYSASSASTASHIFYPASTIGESSTSQHLSAISPISPSRSSISPGHMPGMTALSPRHPGSLSGQYRPTMQPSGGYSLPIPVTGPQDYSSPSLSLTHMTPTVAGASQSTDLDAWQQPTQSVGTGYTDYTGLGLTTPNRGAAAWDPPQYLATGGGATASTGLYTRSAVPYYPSGDDEAAGLGVANTPIVSSLVNRSPYSMHGQPTTTTS